MRTSCSDVIDAIFEHNLAPPCTSETAGYLQYLWFRLECASTASLVRLRDFAHGCPKNRNSSNEWDCVVYTAYLLIRSRYEHATFFNIKRTDRQIT